MIEISSLEDGQRVELQAMIKSVNKGITSKGAPYLSFVLEDQSGSIDAKLWSVSEEQLATLKAGQIVEVQGDVLTHNKQIQYRIQSLSLLDRDSVDMSRFIKTGIYSLEELQTEIKGFIQAISNETVRSVISEMMKEYHIQFFEYPAASKNHHDFYRGLSTHVLGMLKLSKQMCELYPLLDQDYMSAGVILHDLGKVIELSGPIATEYTTQGKLLGHISIMQAEILRVADKLGCADSEEVMLMRHMVLSHHGRYEYGSPVLPMTLEAEMLTFIDNIDARMQSFEKVLDKLEPGEFSPRIFSLENRSIYKPLDFDKESK